MNSSNQFQFFILIFFMQQQLQNYFLISDNIVFETQDLTTAVDFNNLFQITQGEVVKIQLIQLVQDTIYYNIKLNAQFKTKITNQYPRCKILINGQVNYKITIQERRRERPQNFIVKQCKAKKQLLLMITKGLIILVVLIGLLIIYKDRIRF